MSRLKRILTVAIALTALLLGAVTVEATTAGPAAAGGEPGCC